MGSSCVVEGKIKQEAGLNVFPSVSIPDHYYPSGGLHCDAKTEGERMRAEGGVSCNISSTTPCLETLTLIDIYIIYKLGHS